MLISLNWIRDFVPLPSDMDARELAERFTVTCAEVEGIERVAIGAQGLIAARIRSVQEIPGHPTVRMVKLDLGAGKQAETVTSATVVRPAQTVLYGPSGTRLAAVGSIGVSTIAGQTSEGMIVAANTVGMELAGLEPVYLPDTVPPGHVFAEDIFDDWIIEIDNKAITHRPDLWGHYGIAREIAAMLGAPLKPYPVMDLAVLSKGSQTAIPITIDDPTLCPRYSAIVMRGVRPCPSPLWMQLRLGHVGMRPIDALVDLTNYVMADLGQPLHAFDGDKVKGIEVGPSPAGTKFTTLDGVERKLPEGALLIMSNRRPVALAGIMGGLESEVSASTQSILLESANFAPAVIRKCAAALGHRTEASARFEKSLDPAYTILAIQRFVTLAREQFPELELASKVSDAYPSPYSPIRVRIVPAAVSKFVGRPISVEEITRILSALEFKVSPDGTALNIDVPSFRATKDIRIDADIIEEVARCVGYGNIPAALPEVTVRYIAPNPIQVLEQACLQHFSETAGYCEIYGYIWYDAAWNAKLGYEPGPCLELRNPAAAGLQYLRQSLLPDLLAAADRNRHQFSKFRLFELGSVFLPSGDPLEHRRLGLLSARKQRKGEDELLAELKGDVERWALQLFGQSAFFPEARSEKPWDHPLRTSGIRVADRNVGKLSLAPLSLKRTIDEHLANWVMAWAEIDLSRAVELNSKTSVEKLPSIPEFPEVDLDFSFVVPAARRYEEVVKQLAGFAHPCVRRISFVGSYEGAGVEPNHRSLTFSIRLGDTARTLSEAQLGECRTAFESFLASLGYKLRT